MCGRYTLSNAQLTRLLAAIAVQETRDEPSQAFNIVPGTQQIIVLDDTGKRIVQRANWGFVPHWSKDGSKYFINARKETVLTKPAFRDAFLKRRCLVPADGFYEWKKEGKIKQPYWCHYPDRRVFFMAGLYEDRELAPSSSTERTFAIITRESADWMKSLHDRMPVILDAKQAMEWLSANDDDLRIRAQCLKGVLGKADTSELICDPVSTRVNKGDYDDKSCIESISL